MIEVHPRFRPSRSERLKKEPKRKRDGNDEKHLANLRRLPCCICGNPPPNTVHHLRRTGQSGYGMKSPDKFGLPLCMAGFGGVNDCHGQVTRAGGRNELAWFKQRGVEALDLAGALWSNKHSLEAMLAVLKAHRSGT